MAEVVVLKVGFLARLVTPGAPSAVLNLATVGGVFYTRQELRKVCKGCQTPTEFPSEKTLRTPCTALTTSPTHLPSNARERGSSCPTGEHRRAFTVHPMSPTQGDS